MDGSEETSRLGPAESDLLGLAATPVWWLRITEEGFSKKIDWLATMVRGEEERHGCWCSVHRQWKATLVRSQE